jgi:AcrR family transcriptional regulator
MSIERGKMDTKEKIIAAAEKMFIQNGIMGTQMKDIALEVNINRRTLYRYFPTKDELAFEIEMKVMEQISSYLASEMEGIPADLSGFEKVKVYFERVDLSKIRRQIRFTAEFDRHFRNDYPSEQLRDEFLDVLDPQSDVLFHLIREGQKDHTIRDDIAPMEIFQFVGQSFIALFQRLILRENHLKLEYCDNIDFMKLYKDIILKGIRQA